MEVSGIGEAKFAELEDRVTVDNGKGEVTNEDFWWLMTKSCWSKA